MSESNIQHYCRPNFLHIVILAYLSCQSALLPLALKENLLPEFKEEDEEYDEMSL